MTTNPAEIDVDPMYVGVIRLHRQLSTVTAFHRDVQAANDTGRSTIVSSLDYCNSLLAGVTAHNIGRLQRALNSAVTAVSHTTYIPAKDTA